MTHDSTPAADTSHSHTDTSFTDTSHTSHDTWTSPSHHDTPHTDPGHSHHHHHHHHHHSHGHSEDLPPPSYGSIVNERDGRRPVRRGRRTESQDITPVELIGYCLQCVVFFGFLWFFVYLVTRPPPF
ncbi:hypothetical protein L207DRAFT_639461 [Hyaloscypha variabilis F]|uniref:Uncharacterized protein n=1 Tax=Hyaloscypha variabilis (strain UAMH 11265 / GT02V1 / F) TaxID=1149755 RepID=A0A2J6R474_HYAVF|nr:hypothetical protein L207DRAFT_639461 [Hyaloscypha variabilis F]